MEDFILQKRKEIDNKNGNLLIRKKGLEQGRLIRRNDFS